MLEFLNSSNLEILNQSNDPTDSSAQRLEMTDITLGFYGLLESFKAGRFLLNSPCQITGIFFSL